MATGAVIARIMSQYSDKGSKAAQKDIKKLGQNIDAFGRKATKSFAALGVASAAFAVKLGVDAVQGAMAEQKQLAVLATALRNSAGATDAAIKANEDYLDSMELQVAIDNDQLIPALQTLVIGTGNLAQAQSLLSLATDVSAASGKDLGAVSMALSKAVNGNFAALTKLGIPLDKAAVKAKDFAAIQKELTKETKGAAAAAANTFAGKMEKLRLTFGQLADKVGYALIPVLQKLATRIQEEVIPQLQKFIRLNGDDLVRAFDGSIHAIERAAAAMVDIARFVDKFDLALRILGSGILAVIGWLKLLAATQAVRGFLQYMSAGLKLARAEMLLIGPATRGVGAEFAMAGVDLKAFAGNLRGIKGAGNIFQKLSFGAKAFYGALLPSTILLGKVLLVIAALYLAYKAIEWIVGKVAQNNRKYAAQKQLQINEEIAAGQRLADSYDSLEVRKQKAFEKNKAQQDVILSGFKAIEEQVKAANDLNKKNTADAARQARDAAEDAAAYQKKIRIQGMERAGAAKLALFNRKMLTDEKKMLVTLAAIKKNNAKLDKAGIKLTDPDEMTAIQMEAIYQNLLKGGKVILAETTKQQKALDDLKIKAAQEYNLLLTRQQDILKALSGDNKVTIQEVGLLAKQWGLSAQAAQFYVDQVLAIGDGKVDTSEIERTAMSWFGNTGKSAKETAEKYLDFLNEINKGHGNISTEGIKKLAEKWFGGSGEDATAAARKYEKAVLVLKDHKLGKEEVELLMDAWHMSAEEVGNYLLATKIPFEVEDDAKVMFSAALIDAIAKGWDTATTALEKYLKAAKNAAGIVIPVAPIIPGVTDPNTGNPIVTPKAGDPALGGSRTDSAAAAASSAAAAAYAAAKAAGDMNAAAIAAAGVTPSALAAQESGAIGAASIAAQLKKAEAVLASSKITSTYASFRAKEAADEAIAVAAAAKAASDAEDIKFRMKASEGTGSGFDAGFKGLKAGGDQYFTLNIDGNVQTEKDIVDAIRQGLLAAQTNGQGLTLQAI